jgi:hypothetical protein
LPGNALLNSQLSFAADRLFVAPVMFFPFSSPGAGGPVVRPFAGLFAAAVLFSAASLRAGEADGPRNLVSPVDKTLKIQAPPGATVEPTSGGGLKVSYTIEKSPAKSLWLSVKRVFAEPEAGNAVAVDVPNFEGVVLLNVWNEESRQGFKRLGGQAGNVVDLHGLSYKGSQEDFSGKVRAVEIAMQVDKGEGDHVVEIERFVLDR